MSPSKGTAWGGVSLLLWATLASLVALTSRLPSFQNLGLTFTASTVTLGALWLYRGVGVRALFVGSPRAWALGLFGIFGYHASFFVALKVAPPSEANLINYLWPLLLALLSGVATGERLGPKPIVGCLLGFAGALQLVAPSGGASGSAPLTAYLPAVACAVIWPVYSVLSKRVGAPAPLFVGWCAATALLGLGAHAAFEGWVAPSGAEWAAIVAMGVGPAGIALWTWDLGMKHGHIRALAALSYLEPLASTLLLVALGRAAASGRLWIACLLIMGGAFVGGWDALRKK